MRSGLTLWPTKIVPSGSICPADCTGGAADAVAAGFALGAFATLFGSTEAFAVASASTDTDADFFFADLLARFAIAPHPFEIKRIFDASLAPGQRLRR
jgi:hypothetical protein